MFDYHIHTYFGPCDSPKEFLRKAALGGITGGGIISIHPAGYFRDEGEDQRWEVLLDRVLEYTSETPGFRPLFWIDPTDKDASVQIQKAAERGVAGFKIICNHFYPADVLKELEQIAETGLPLNFHCGILYSTHPAAEYNRPARFECLMELKKLRFSLAHAGWPWTDEYNSIIGEFFWGKNNVDAYVDLTPGTPLCYRRDVLRKLCLCGFGKLKERILWGTDQRVNDYDSVRAACLTQYDRKIIAEIAEDMPSYLVPGRKGPDYSDLWEHVENNMTAFFSKCSR